MAAAVAMCTGCLKSTDSSSKFQPVSAGLSIYSCANNQTHMALMPAGAAIRLGMLLAEAAKQNKTDELESVAVDGVRVMTALFGADTRITKLDDGYRIVYSNSGGASNDAYRRSGSVTVHTDGVGQLIETGSANRWTVTVGDGLQVNPSAREPLHIAGGTTSIYYEEGAYRIEVAGFVGYFAHEIRSDWNCSFEWRPTDARLTYSECSGKESALAGEGSGTTFYSLNTLSMPTQMRYRLTDGRYLSSGHIVGGTETAWLTSISDYDTKVYPSPEVSVVWSFDADRISYIVKYNGVTVSSK